MKHHLNIYVQVCGHHWRARGIGCNDGNVGAADPLPAPPLLGITLKGMLNGTLPPMSSPDAPAAEGTATPATGSARCLTRRMLLTLPTLLGSHPCTVPMVVYPSSSPSSFRPCGTGTAMLPLPPPPPPLLLSPCDSTAAPDISMPPDCCTRGTVSPSPLSPPPLRLSMLRKSRSRRRRATSATEIAPAMRTAR